MASTTEKFIFTEAEAADELGLKRRVLEDERARGRIEFNRIVGNRIRYTRKQLEDYLKNHPLNQRQEAAE